jgi:hypothetical protein
MLSTIIRIAGIGIGIAALLRLATDTGMVEYNVLFQSWMDRLRGIVELGGLVDLLEMWVVLPFLSWLQSFWFNIPELKPFWGSVLVLLWLGLGSASRRLAAGRTLWVQIGAFSWASFCAISGAALSGILPTVNSDEFAGGFLVYYVTISITCIYIVGILIFSKSFLGKPSPALYVFAGLLTVPLTFGSIAYLDYEILDVVIDSDDANSFLANSLLLVMMLFLILAFYAVIWSYLTRLGDYRNHSYMFGSFALQYGVDVMSVILGALGIAYFVAV